MRPRILIAAPQRCAGTLSGRIISLSIFSVFYGLDWVATGPATVALTNEVFGRRDAAETAEDSIHLGNEPGELIDADLVMPHIAPDNARGEMRIDPMCRVVLFYLSAPPIALYYYTHLDTRTAHGRCGLLLLHSSGLAPPTGRFWIAEDPVLGLRHAFMPGITVGFVHI
jgi:hypothetical protein